jgi:hypothetical protein
VRDEFGTTAEWRLAAENWRILQNIFYIATCTANFTWDIQELNSGFRGQKPATNSLNSGTLAWRRRQFVPPKRWYLAMIPYSVTTQSRKPSSPPWKPQTSHYC